jgi:hypothetical protein
MRRDDRELRSIGDRGSVDLYQREVADLRGRVSAAIMRRLAKGSDRQLVYKLIF